MPVGLERHVALLALATGHGADVHVVEGDDAATNIVGERILLVGILMNINV